MLSVLLSTCLRVSHHSKEMSGSPSYTLQKCRDTVWENAMEMQQTHFAVTVKSIRSSIEQRVEANNHFYKVWMRLSVWMPLEMISRLHVRALRSSYALLLFAFPCTFNHLSLVRTFTGSKKQQARGALIGPQRIGACSREHFLEAGWLENSRYCWVKGTRSPEGSPGDPGEMCQIVIKGGTFQMISVYQ